MQCEAVDRVGAAGRKGRARPQAELRLAVVGGGGARPKTNQEWFTMRSLFYFVLLIASTIITIFFYNVSTALET